jgi:subtilisin family serine protease
VSVGTGGNGGSGGSSNAGNTGGSGERKLTVRRSRSGVPAINERRYIPDQLVVELNGSEQELIGLLNRFRLARLQTVPIPLLNTTFYRLRILDGSTVPAKIGAIASSFRTVQPNYLFTFAQAEQVGVQPADNADAAQYALAKLRLGEAHALARGDKVPVAVIDSGIDLKHPALAGAVEKSFDALDSNDGPHSHGTAIAGIIAGHARLTGAAPAVRILAARAFSTNQGSTVSIIASIDWATAQGARVINMSFAGPSDPALGRSLAAAHKKGVVLIAAAGNAGPKSPPLWPAADPNVIAVTATDPDDHLYAMANRGHHVAIAAPGVDILVAQPGSGYKMESGTSFSAAFVSGVAALVIERKPQLTPDAVKKVLLGTARDLGPKGRDDQFGAGLMDAFQAVSTVEKATDAALQVPRH